MKQIALFLTISLTIIFFACNNTDKPIEKGQTIKEEIDVSKSIPEWTKDKVIYELNVRQYSPEGTFNAVLKDLDRLQELGVDIIWFMPISPVGELNRKGSLGSYYSIQNYTAINPEFGTMEDFVELVNEAHKLGMYVLIDWVANHTAWDHDWIKTHPEYYSTNDDGDIISPVDDWADVADLNYDNKDLWQVMIDEMKFWLNEANIDGFRCDVAVMVPTEFWDEARKQLDEVKPVFMLAEAEKPDLHNNAFDACYGWYLMHTINEIAKGNKLAYDIDSVIEFENSTFNKDVYHMRFTTNHDENSWNGTVFERLGNGAKMYSVLCYTLPGIPLIYSGQEAAMNKRLEFFEKDNIDWGEYEYQSFYKSLNALKKSNSALWNGEYGGELYRLNFNNNGEILYSFYRIKDDNIVISIFNFSDSDISSSINIPEEITGSYKEYFSKENVEFINKTTIDLPSFGYKVFIKE